MELGEEKVWGTRENSFRRVVGETLGKTGKAWTLMSTGACWGKRHKVLQVTTEHNGYNGEFDLKVDIQAKSCQKH